MIGCSAIDEIGRASRDAHAESVDGEQQMRECGRIAGEPAMGADEWAGLGDDGDGFSAAVDGGDAAEKLAGVHGRIFFGEGVAARGERDAITLGPFAHDAMDERAATEQEENNFAAASLGCTIGGR